MAAAVIEIPLYSMKETKVEVRKGDVPICMMPKSAKHSKNPPLVANRPRSGHKPHRIPNTPIFPSLCVSASGSSPLATPVHLGL